MIGEASIVEATNVGIVPVIDPQTRHVINFAVAEPSSSLQFVGEQVQLAYADRLRQQEVEPQETVITSAILKMVAGCNYNCHGDDYVCYEGYDGDEWKLLPGIMSFETVKGTAESIGQYVKEHKLKQFTGIFHGGEPLFTTKRPLNPEGMSAVSYYREVIKILRETVGGISPETQLDLTMHCNGSKLREDILDLFAEENVTVGVSLDGPRAVNDLNRVIGEDDKRTSTYDQTVRGLNLLCEKYPQLYTGILCTVSKDSDPIAVFETLRSFRPPTIDLMLPYATWDQPPLALRTRFRSREAIEAIARVRTVIAEGGFKSGGWPGDIVGGKLGAVVDDVYTALAHPFSPLYREVVPYADWLLRFYYKNAEEGNPLQVRFFDSIKRLARGESSLVDGIGPESGRHVVIRPNGTFELPDYLNVNRGSTHLGMNVREHSLDMVAAELSKVGLLGKKRLPTTCSSCPLAHKCGGGHPGTQHSKANGTDNASIYCLDLEELFRQIGPEDMAPKIELMSRMLSERQVLQSPIVVRTKARNAAPLTEVERRIWLDLAPRELERHIGELSLGTLHIATLEEQELYGFVPGALVPDSPRPATVEELRGYLADEQVPASNCIGIVQQIPEIDALLQKVTEEVADPNFVVGAGAEYRTQGGGRAMLLDYITNNANDPTTIIPNPKNVTPHSFDRKRPGMHVEHFKDRRNPIDIRTQYARRNLLIPVDGPRYHLVLLVSSLAIAERLHPGNRYHVPTARDLRKYYREYPEEAHSMPVLWIKMTPDPKGLAYGSLTHHIKAIISPIEVGDHDGSTRGIAVMSSLAILNGSFPRHAFSLRARLY